MSKLKIYACSGVGDAGKVQEPAFTTEGTNAITNTQAMNKLLSLINMCVANAQLVGTTPEEIMLCYQDMDIYAVCFYFAQLYAGNNAKLQEAGYAINKYMEDGRFKISSSDMSAHSERVDEIIDGVQALIDNEDYDRKDSSFISWWNKDILPYNTIGLPENIREKLEQMQKTNAAAPSRRGASWQSNEDLNTYLNDGGTYFIYTYFTDAQLRQLPAVFRIKKKKQMEVYQYCKEAFVPIYGTEADMRRIIANSIKMKFHTTPEDLCHDIVTGNAPEGVGEPISAIISAIASLITVLVTLLSVILSYCAQIVAAKYTTPDDPSAGIAEESDFEGWEPQKKNRFWLWLAGGIAAWFILK